MPKKLKLNMDELKIQSFITALSDEEKRNLKGAGTGVDCDTTGSVCCTSNQNCGSICQTQCGSGGTCC